MKQPVVHLFKQLGIELSNQQKQQFKSYYELLIEWNKKLNLTSITEEHEVYVKHFYDSVCLTKVMDPLNNTLLDVGSGAGFPSIPLKIIFPSLQITIIDALAKRIKFLELVTDELGIEATLIHGRAEEYDARGTFDIVTARAVANLQILSELCIPFVRTDGLFLAMKGPNFEEELMRSKQALTTLGAKLERVVHYDMDGFQRCIIVIRKIKDTPSKYPRRYNKIKSKPL